MRGTAWHTHPLGQTLIVVSGFGRVQRLGGPIEEIRPGDIVWFEPWRKALARRIASHRDDPCRHCRSAGMASVVDWLEHVTDEQYQA